MKLYMFQCGCLRTKTQLFESVPATGEERQVPVPFYLIEHPRGNVLFDAGNPLSYVGVATGEYIPVMTEDDHVAAQLAKIGMKASDVTHIVLSHLHSDHFGGIEAFSGTSCYVRKAEVEAGNNKEIVGRYQLDWQLIDGRAEVDLFGDGKLTLISTAGHTPGHQSLLVKLEGWGDTLLAADCVSYKAILDGEGFPANCRDREETARTIDMIREMCSGGVRIITGHDPQEWNDFRLAPDFYE